MKKFFAFILFIFLGTAFAFAAIPSFGKVPIFSFVDQNGKPFSDSDLNGTVWIANFVFTRCQQMCPLIIGQTAVLQEQLKDHHVALVSFSVDPEHDRPEVLARVADSHQAIPGKWFFVTTDRKQTMWEFVSRGFMLGVDEPTAEDLKNGAEPVMHSSRFVLVDQTGQIRGYYDSQDPKSMEALVQDAVKLESST